MARTSVKKIISKGGSEVIKGIVRSVRKNRAKNISSGASNSLKHHTTNVGKFKYSQARTVAVEDLRKEYQKLRNRIERIKDKYGDEIPAVKSYYEAGLDKFSTKGKDLDAIVKLREQVDYVSNLRTAKMTGSGIKDYITYVEPVIELYKSPETRDVYDKITNMYNRMVEEMNILEKFKYQVLEMLTDLFMADVNPAEIADTVRRAYDTLYENDGVGKYEFQFGGQVRRTK